MQTKIFTGQKVRPPFMAAHQVNKWSMKWGKTILAPTTLEKYSKHSKCVQRIRIWSLQNERSFVVLYNAFVCFFLNFGVFFSRTVGAESQLLAGYANTELTPNFTNSFWEKHKQWLEKNTSLLSVVITKWCRFK